MAEAANTVDIVLQAKNEASAVFDQVAKDLLGLRGTFSEFSAEVSAAAKSFAPLGTALTAVGGAVAAAVTTAGLAVAAMAKSAADIGDNLNDMAKRTGIAVETLSVLRLAAEESGTSLGGLAMGFKFLSANMLSAAQGGKEDAAAFAQLGVAVLDTGGKLRNTNQVMLDLAERFARMPDGAEKTALAMKVFGRAAFEIIPFLNEGREGIEKMLAASEDLGQKWTTDMARAADTFNDTLAEIGAAVAGLKDIIGQEAIVAFQPLLDASRDMAKAMVRLFENMRADLGREFKAMVPLVLEAMQLMVDGVSLAAKLMVGSIGAISKVLFDLQYTYNNTLGKIFDDEDARRKSVAWQNAFAATRGTMQTLFVELEKTHGAVTKILSDYQAAGTSAQAAVKEEAVKVTESIKLQIPELHKAAEAVTKQADAHKKVTEAAKQSAEATKAQAVFVIDLYQQVLQLQSAMFGGASRGPRYQQDLTLGAHPVVYGPKLPPLQPTYLNPAIDPYRSPQGAVLNAMAAPSMPAPVEVAVEIDGREVARAVQRAVSRGNTLAVPGL